MANYTCLQVLSLTKIQLVLRIHHLQESLSFRRKARSKGSTNTGTCRILGPVTGSKECYSWAKSVLEASQIMSHQSSYNLPTINTDSGKEYMISQEKQSYMELQKQLCLLEQKGPGVRGVILLWSVITTWLSLTPDVTVPQYSHPSNGNNTFSEDVKIRLINRYDSVWSSQKAT